MKLRLADLHPGLVVETPGIVVTEAHLVAFAGLSGDFFELHTDDDFARSHGFRGRVAHGLLGLALVDGLKNRATARIDAIASLEWTWHFAAPIYPGDRIHARMEVIEVRATSKPGRGIVRLAIEALNQHGERVQHGANVLLVNA